MTAAMKLKDTPSKESYGKPIQPIKKQRHLWGLTENNKKFCKAIILQ